mgnify:CR=1 FL=1
MSEQATNTDLTIVRKENVQMIAQTAPEVYKNNTISCKKCTDFGKRLLVQIKEHGMTDELDMQCATYINKARNTVKKMNTSRSAITKIFDQIRSEFTGMENAIDPTKITDALGWYPETKFEVGIVKTIEWYLNNQDWVEEVTSGDYQKYYERMYGKK